MLQSKAKIKIVDNKSSNGGILSKVLKAAVSYFKHEDCQCLFNPSEFSIERSASYAEHKIPGLDRPILQFVNGEAEVMRFSLFFDTYAAGTSAQDLKLAATSKLPTILKLDVRRYTAPFYNLLNVSQDKHAPNTVAFEWGSMKFEGYVTDIQQRFTMFAPTGFPLRATLNITLKSNKLDNNIRNSPDRTKQRVIKSGDRLYSYAKDEYGSCTEWRRIADANHLENPRLLRSGENIVIPAVIK